MPISSQPLSAKKTREAVKVTREVVNRQGQALKGTIEHLDALTRRLNEAEARIKQLEASGTIFDRFRHLITGK